ncbi:MAG: sigma-70 family RNA polymerase sigma factor [Chloroflexi bacterium]|nr:sigma-70 family RNA polymerase sigma factor [Chloroflexota bacterium]
MEHVLEQGQSLVELPENELVELAKTDVEAFGELYMRYVDKIYSYIYYRTSNHQDAEDLTSRVFHRALAALPDYEDRGLPFSAWLYRIAHNLVANFHRDRKRKKLVPLESLILSSFRREAPDHVAERRDEAEQLLDVIRRLPEDRQQLLILKFVDRLPNAEIGEIMGRSEGAIKSLYHRTLVSLREELQRLQEAPEENTNGEKPKTNGSRGLFRRRRHDP